MADGPERYRLVQEFKDIDIDVDLCDNGDALREKLGARPGPCILLIDTDVSGADTEKVLEALQEPGLNVCTILLTDENTANMAGVWAGLGAWGYLVKPVRWGRLNIYLERIRNHFRRERERESLRAYLATDQGVSHAPVSYSRAMKETVEAARAVAGSSVPALLQGEYGTDKFILARFMHDAGGRAAAPFIAVDCAAQSPAEIEAGLFGDAARRGFIHAAGDGTIFINEIAALPLHAQEKLLEVFLTGENGIARAVARLIAATSSNLALEVGRETFNSDLYMLFNETVVTLPPLRERVEDVPELARRCLARAGLDPARRKNLSDDAIDVLAHYYWPGNEQELKNVMERAAALAAEAAISRDDVLRLLTAIQPPAPEPEAPAEEKPKEFIFPSLSLPLKEVEKVYIARVLKKNNFHRKTTALTLGISRKTLYSKIKEHNLINRIVRKDPDI